MRSKNATRVLLLEPDKPAQKSLYEILSRADYHVDIAGNPKKASSLIKSHDYRAIILGVADRDIALVDTIKQAAPFSGIIVLASSADAEFAVQSVKKGAFDCLLRPVEDHKILNAVRKVLAGGPVLASAEKKDEISFSCEGESSYCGIVGQSSQMRAIFGFTERIKNSKSTVLIRGASGTGKRLVAQAIHQSDKKRSRERFVEVSCGALPREIIESELFGHVKGAFTGAISDRKGRFELADKGTLLLDDIDALPLDLQVKLLRVLQQKEFERVGDHRTMKVDTRIIATTNGDLESMVAEKKFREDLFYRLNVLLIQMPSLQDRRQDIPALVAHFIKLHAGENHKKIKGVSEDAMRILVEYNWPGNVRQLENIIERAVILDVDGVITEDDLPEVFAGKQIKPIIATGESVTGCMNMLKDFLKHPEKGHILNVLKEVDGNKKKAAEILGVNRTTLYNKLRKYNINTEQIQ